MKFFIYLSILFQSSYLYANILGSDIQNFNPTSNGLDFITVHSSRTLDQLQLNIGYYGNYSMNALPYSTVATSDNSQSLVNPNDQIIYSHLSLGLGIIKGWDIGVNATFMNSQSIERSNFVFTYGDPGVDDFRINSKFRLVDESSCGGALILSLDLDQIEDNPFVGDNSGPIFNIEGALDFKLTERLLWAVNFGYRLRNEGTPIPNGGILPISDQLIYSTALSYLIGSKGSAVIGELFGSYPIDQPPTVPTDRQLSNFEGLVSYRWRAIDNLDIYGGVGSEVYHGLGSPDFRAFLGANFRWGFLDKTEPRKTYEAMKPTEEPLESVENQLSNENDENDGDGDGVPDSKDKCPNTWNQNYVDSEGCTDNGSGKPNVGTGVDSDSDGIDDSIDKCPQTTPGARVNAYGCEIPNY